MKFLKISMYLSKMLMGFSLMSLFIGVSFYLSSKVLFIEWELITIFSLSLIMTILVDWMSLIFMGFVMLISSMVMMYSTIYMKEETNYVRFIWLVYLFVLSMVLLIISPNMVSILLGWDGLGLVSYCLVIYYQNVKSANAGMLTILSNRIGDVAILLCISWLFNFGGWNFYYLMHMFTEKDLWMIEFLVVLAAMTKSAQIPFSAWLPAAMAAPTPVSSLVHSSTLVTAGVYLLIRFSELIGVSLMLLMISIWTMLMSGINANLEMDLKKVIALSTLSQLGVMMMTISLGMKELAFFHLLSHALFKSLLFLCAGVFIHGMGDIQDVRDLGGVSLLTPITSLYFLGCSLSLCGFPFLSGFYSKDMILESYFMMTGLNSLIYLMIIISILMTGLYSSRLAIMLFLKPLGIKKMNNLCEEMLMVLPMSLLFYSATVSGSLMMWWFIPPVLIILSMVVKMMIFFLTMTMMILVVLYFVNLVLLNSSKNIKIISFFGLMMNLPMLSTYLLMPLLKLGETLLKQLDQSWLEMMGGQGFIKNTMLMADKADLFNFLNLKLYLSLFFLTVIVLLMIL
uniref:NADH-ubiquinone oxidoreductase chain 5 n=1 Tax=Allonychiurus kimi TaxID=2779777 RepID=A0A7M3UYU2_9HEXA|nr:NADH dehydrogenase subunit 5 [Allonychiurus kimi]QOL12119.1 NADH dehydrogenase subunit 5 [Allonychiurus kimi]